MSTRTTKHDVISEFRRGEILRAARTVFARTGYDAATVDEIASAAGVAKGTLYAYFPSKRNLYLAAVKQGVDKLLEATRRNMALAATPIEKVRTFVSTRLWFARQNPGFAAMYFGESGNLRPGGFRKEFRAFYHQQTRVLEAELRQAALGGWIRPLDADAAAFFVYELTRALITGGPPAWHKSNLDRQAYALFDLISKGLGISDRPLNQEDAA